MLLVEELFQTKHVQQNLSAREKRVALINYNYLFFSHLVPERKKCEERSDVVGSTE